jgi:hypothetical protein
MNIARSTGIGGSFPAKSSTQMPSRPIPMAEASISRQRDFRRSHCRTPATAPMIAPATVNSARMLLKSRERHTCQ